MEKDKLKIYSMVLKQNFNNQHLLILIFLKHFNLFFNNINIIISELETLEILQFYFFNFNSLFLRQEILFYKKELFQIIENELNYHVNLFDFNNILNSNLIYSNNFNKKINNFYKMLLKI